MAKRKQRSPKGRHSSSLRPFWSGTISFGLVSVPVNLYPAIRSGGTPLRMLSPKGSPLKRRYYCPEHHRDVDRDQLIRGYEVEDGRHVLVEDEELDALAPRKSRDIDLTRFVPREQVPPRFFERAYYLTPSGDSTKAYRLLAEVMQKSGRVGIATFVMRGKEYMVAILAENGILQAETLRFEDELRRADEVGLPQPVDVAKAEVAEIAKLLRKHVRQEVPEQVLQDRSSARLREIIETKRKKGKDVVETAEAAGAEDEEEGTAQGRIDLLETIRRSLRAGHGGNGKNGTEGQHRKGTDARARPKDRLGELTKEELYDRAQQRNVPGRSKMTKAQLVRALRRS